MAIAAVLTEDLRAIEIVLHVVFGLGTVLLLVRLGLHLRERGETLAEVRRLAAENERLVALLREELVARERVHARLVDASRMSAVGELAAAVAHEVNNPLTGVLGYADLLLSSATPGTPEYDDLSVIRTEALRVRDRVRALLDFATPRRPELVPTDLAELITVPIGLLRYHLERRGITLDERLVAVPAVPVDPPSIQQVLINVISDVAAAMPTGGRLVVTSGQAGDHVMITIEPIAPDLDGVALAASFSMFKDTGADDGPGIASSLGVLRGHGATIGLHKPVLDRTVVEIQIPLIPESGAVAVYGATTMMVNR
jgi:signal transduction histidine kinase